MYREAEQRDPDTPSLTLAGYAELGGPAGVFRRHLDELFNRVSVGDHLLLKLVLQEMTTAHATKLPTTVSRLSQSGLLASTDELQGLLDKLVIASLARKYDSEQEPWYELVHDRLVQALPEHFAGDQQFLRLRYMRELVSQLSKGFSDGMVGAPLLNRQQLADLIEPFRKYIRFSESELNLLFRSAVVNKHNVAMWQDAFESASPGKSRDVLLEMLSYPDTRRGAVTSVGLLRVTEAAHRARCLEIALHDNDPAMATAASETLSVVAGAEEAAKITVALKDRSMRPRALWLLADLTENASVIAQVPLRTLRVAKREADRRHLLRNWDEVQRGGWQGIRIGFWTGIMSGLAAIAFWCVAMAWLHEVEVALYAINISAIVISSMTFGAICGYAVGRAMTMLQATDRNLGWIFLLQNLGALGPLAFAFVLGVFVILFALVSTARLLTIPETDIVILAIMLCVIAPAVVLASIGLTEWTLPPVRWHRVRGPMAVAIQVFSFSWLLSIGMGALLTLISDHSSKYAVIIILGTLLAGSWYSICAISVSGVLVESIWKCSQTRPVFLRRWLSLVPVITLVMTIISLSWQASSQFWAPIVDITPYGRASGDLMRPLSLTPARANWTLGRWLVIRNSAPNALVLSTSPTNQSMGLDDLWLIQPGTDVRWFPSEMAEFYPLQQIDWQHENLSPCTYAIVPLRKEGISSSVWTTELHLEKQANSVAIGQVACRAFLADNSTIYFTGHGSEIDERIREMQHDMLRWVHLGSAYGESSDVEIRCDPQFNNQGIDRVKLVNRMEMIILFESITKHCLR